MVAVSLKNAKMIYTYSDQLRDEGYAKGLAKGKAEGLAEGALNKVVQLTAKGLLGYADGAREAEMPESEFRTLVAQFEEVTANIEE